MRLKFTIRKELKVIAALLLLTFLIAFSERRQSDRAINDVIINMENVHENHYLDGQDIADLIGYDRENLLGATLGQINMKEMEQLIEADRYVRDAQLYLDLKGNMIVNCALHRPVARLIRPDDTHGYIAEDGTIMPVSSRFTSRVILVSGDAVPDFLVQKNLKDSDEGGRLFAMIQMIRNDEFWTAQIAQLDINRLGYVGIYPQIGGQVIEFGTITNLDRKFRKMKVFYKEILPRMGWNTYKRINVEYDGQIVAE